VGQTSQDATICHKQQKRQVYNEILETFDPKGGDETII
jgi:hypothetical protein